MKCPVCDQALREVERNGIHIDICPGCKGVWLDRGELDKLIERETRGVSETSFPEPPPAYRQDSYPSRRRPDDDDDDDRRGYGDPRRRKKRGLLGEIFDIFD